MSKVPGFDESVTTRRNVYEVATSVDELISLMNDDTGPQFIDLESKKATEAQLDDIAANIQHNNRLLGLGLKDQKMRDRELAILMPALIENDTLTELSLSNNYLEEEAGNMIGLVLEKNSKINFIDLRINTVRDGGTVYLLDSLKKNFTLLTLELEDNFINEDLMQDVADKMTENKLHQRKLKQVKKFDLGRSLVGRGDARLAFALFDAGIQTVQKLTQTDKNTLAAVEGVTKDDIKLLKKMRDSGGTCTVS